VGFVVVDQKPADWANRFMFYYVNLGTHLNPQMRIIGDLISEGLIPQATAENFNLVNSNYGPIYSRA